jgi:hypothetical protein
VGKAMNFLKVTSVGPFGEHTMSHRLDSLDIQDKLIIATLEGIINAGHAIKSFEVVEGK